MTTLFETENLRTEPAREQATPYQEMPRACTRCGQAINTQREGWRSSPTGIAHVTCPTSAAIQALPTVSEEEAAAISEGQPPTPEHEYMTLQEAADLLRVHINTIHALIKSGQLPALRLIGRRRILVDRQEVLKQLERVPVQPVPVVRDLAAPMAAGFTSLEA